MDIETKVPLVREPAATVRVPVPAPRQGGGTISGVTFVPDGPTAQDRANYRRYRLVRSGRVEEATPTRLIPAEVVIAEGLGGTTGRDGGLALTIQAASLRPDDALTFETAPVGAAIEPGGFLRVEYDA